jgi:hypothetical protein
MWEHYWDGVCDKMRHRASWVQWGTCAALLGAVGGLLIAGASGSLLMIVLGCLAVMAGLCLLWICHFCNGR